MRLHLYQVDAFTTRAFAGNPAAVCPLERWLPAATLQSIAAEMNLSETAFLVPRASGGDWDLRWFTPCVEVDLCGHATLASAHILASELETTRKQFEFHTRSGILRVERHGAGFRMDFPARPPARVDAPDGLAAALGQAPLEVWRARDLVAVYADAATVRSLAPDYSALARLDAYAVCATAPGTHADQDVDFVSRFFAPAQGVPEDPVTGSAHCTLTPLWAAKLGAPKLGGARYRARQVGRRSGELECELAGARVALFGQALTVLRGELEF
jgi:predicted PhzF superfamily epimerase YddE/YHI9